MTAALDITKGQRRTLLTLLRRFIPGVAVWAYGSRVKWTARPNSDLDLVVFSTPAQNPLVSGLKESLAESDLPFLVDIQVWNEVSERIHAIIRNEYVVLQEAEEKQPRGETPGEWKEKTLGELTENFDGQRIPVKESERKPGSYPYYGASGIVDHIDKYIFDGEYLLIAEDGENLRTHKTPVAFLARGKFWVNNHAHIVTGNSRADTRFLMYAVNQADINGYLTGSTMPKLTQGNMNRIPILAPPIAEQRAIASVLASLDDKIELNGRMNKTLEALAQALFESLFVEKTQDTLPKGWGAGKVSDLATLSRDSLDPGGFPEETFDHYSIPAFDEGPTPKPEKGDAIKSNKFVVSSDCVLVSKLNPRIPRIWLPDLRSPNRAICSTEFLVTIPKTGVSREFLFCLFKSDSFASEFGTMVTGTSGSHQRVKPESLLGMATIIPSNSVIQNFTEMTAPLLKRVNQNIAESRTLAALRHALLPKLLSGELRVPTAHKFVGART
jgi:type I restriction enzyme S subunit